MKCMQVEPCNSQENNCYNAPSCENESVSVKLCQDFNCVYTADNVPLEQCTSESCLAVEAVCPEISCSMFLDVCDNGSYVPVDSNGCQTGCRVCQESSELLGAPVSPPFSGLLGASMSPPTSGLLGAPASPPLSGTYLFGEPPVSRSPPDTNAYILGGAIFGSLCISAMGWAWLYRKMRKIERCHPSATTNPLLATP